MNEGGFSDDEMQKIIDRLVEKLPPKLRKTIENLGGDKELQAEISGLLYAPTVVGQQPDLSQPSSREEANVIAAYAFRTGFLEDLHAGKHSDKFLKGGYGRITQEEMKKLMIESSAKVETWMRIKEILQTIDPRLYILCVRNYSTYTRDWEKEKKKYDIEKGD
jgi:hypothetical protein